MITKEAMQGVSAKKRAIQSVVCGIMIGLICGFVGAGAVSYTHLDGIHMDDYFYPSFTKRNVKKAFDAKEYKKSSYKKKKKSIYTYRRAQVNTLVIQMKKAVKSVDPNVTYGISPAGNIDNLTSKYSYYVDIYKWLNSTEYVDYICPQVYWGFKHPTAEFNKVTDRWIKAAKSKKVKLYIGIAVYRAGHNVGQNRAERKEWKSDTKVLKKQVQYARKKHVDGFAFFDYQDLKSKTSAKACLLYTSKQEIRH